MKNVFLFFLPLLIFSVSCSDSNELEEGKEIAESFEQQIMKIPNNTFENPELITAYSEVMKEVLTMAKEPNFRSFVYENAQKLSDDGNDYNVYLSKISKQYKGTDKFGKSASKIETLSSKIESMNNGLKPMIFFPKAETIEDELATNKRFNISNNLDEPIAVLKGAYYDDYSVPGYTLNNNGNLEYTGLVTEEYAWENDVYVIGVEELIDCSDCISATSNNSSINVNSDERINGRSEYGGWIQIVDLNDVEHWFSGKLELRQVITGVRSGATVLRDINYSKTKRKHFKNDDWHDYKTFLFNWNLSNLGDYTIEKWIERDGGPTGTFTISMPATSYKPATGSTPEVQAFPGGSIKLNMKKDDDELGSSIIQFTDNISQIYPLGRASIRRK